MWLTPLLIAAVALSIFLWARFRANHPPEIGKIRLAPYTGIMFIALLIILLCFAYGLELLRAA